MSSKPHWRYGWKGCPLWTCKKLNIFNSIGNKIIKYAGGSELFPVQIRLFPNFWNGLHSSDLHLHYGVRGGSGTDYAFLRVSNAYSQSVETLKGVDWTFKEWTPKKLWKKANFCGTIPRSHYTVCIFEVQYILTKDCVICRYSQTTARAFSTMLLFYITLTSVVLSVLCFEILMVDAFADSVRFTLHLLGWLIILLSICYNAQLVLDQVRFKQFAMLPKLIFSSRVKK